MNTHPESGNVFIYIFMGIALFGLLTYALTQGTRTGSASLTNEQATVAANEILAQADTINQAYQKIRLRGFAEDEVSFVNSVSTLDYTNNKCPSDVCKIFHVGGGAINYPKAPTNGNSGEEWFFTGQTPIWSAGGNSPRYDLVSYLPNINENVCRKLNVTLGVVENLSDPIPTANQASLWINRFTGSISGSSNYVSGTNVTGHMSLCVQLNDLQGPISSIGPDNAYYFINTIYAG